MVVFAAPFSQVSGHLLPFQAGDLNPLPVDQGLDCSSGRSSGIRRVEQDKASSGSRERDL
jgi:hypothetical protein